MYQDNKEETAELIRSVLRSYNRQFFIDSETINLVEEQSGHFIGGLTATRDFDSIYIDYFVVEKEYRKSGIGRKLLLRLEEIAKEKNVKRIIYNIIKECIYEEKNNVIFIYDVSTYSRS